MIINTKIEINVIETFDIKLLEFRKLELELSAIYIYYKNKNK